MKKLVNSSWFSIVYLMLGFVLGLVIADMPLDSAYVGIPVGVFFLLFAVWIFAKYKKMFIVED